jgi:hypothetical protein
MTPLKSLARDVATLTNFGIQRGVVFLKVVGDGCAIARNSSPTGNHRALLLAGEYSGLAPDRGPGGCVIHLSHIRKTNEYTTNSLRVLGQHNSFELDLCGR